MLVPQEMNGTAFMRPVIFIFPKEADESTLFSMALAFFDLLSIVASQR